jgi:ubiquinone/menaquinone biosynthesis C-methylase UbiE
MKPYPEKLFWDVYARLYDDLNHVLPYREEMDEVMKAIGGEALPANVRLLDAACGTGILLDRLARAYPHWELYGVDRSPPMLACAQKKLEGRAKLSLKDLPAGLNGLAPQSLDVVTSVNTLYALPSPRDFLRELHRILRPGGKLVLVNPWNPSLNSIWANHLRQIWERKLRGEAWDTFRRAHRLLGIHLMNLEIKRRVRGQTFHFVPPLELASLVSDSAFEVLRVDREIYAGTCVLIEARRE